MIDFPMLRMECVTLITNLQIESCLKGYPATVCCADELPAHVGVRPRTFIVNTDTCDCCEVTGWRFTFPSWVSPNLSIRTGNAPKRITAVSPTSTDRNTTTVRLFLFFRYAVLLQDVEDYVLLHVWVFTKIFT